MNNIQLLNLAPLLLEKELLQILELLQVWRFCFYHLTECILELLVLQLSEHVDSHFKNIHDIDIEVVDIQLGLAASASHLNDLVVSFLPSILLLLQEVLHSIHLLWVALHLERILLHLFAAQQSMPLQRLQCFLHLLFRHLQHPSQTLALSQTIVEYVIDQKGD